MAATILGLDIGGANLKAATADGHSRSVPFALWRQPERLPAALAEVAAEFAEAQEFAVTMTGELCDCFETKRRGVEAIVAATTVAAGARRVRFWSTDGSFLNAEDACRNHMKVAAANWHATAALAGRLAPSGPVILLDVGSTTADIIPIVDGAPSPSGRTDDERMTASELLYTGVRRTPLCAIMGWEGAAEFFATTLDAYITLGLIPEDPSDRDTADGRPATRENARSRLCRMYCGDAETISRERTDRLAQWVYEQQLAQIRRCTSDVRGRLAELAPGGEEVTYVLAGSGEFLARQAANAHDSGRCISLAGRLGTSVSVCAAAHAAAVLASEA